MTETTGSIITEGVVIEGEVEAAGAIEVFGTVNGQVKVSNLLIHEGGKVVGTVFAQNITANGLFQGEATARGLLDIGPQGSVRGNVHYVRLSMREGGELSADLRNIPPTLAGDMKMSVARGKAVRLTTNDLTAIDPDNTASELRFAVSHMQNGFVVRLSEPKKAAQSFTQEELEKGGIVFVHDGKSSNHASFAVSVTDIEGASAGPARTVEVDVTG